MSIVFYNKIFKYSDEVPIVNDDDIHIFSSRGSKKEMIFKMQNCGMKIPDDYNKKSVAKVFTQYRLLCANEDFCIITNVTKKWGKENDKNRNDEYVT